MLIVSRNGKRAVILSEDIHTMDGDVGDEKYMISIDRSLFHYKDKEIRDKDFERIIDAYARGVRVLELGK